MSTGSTAFSTTRPVEGLEEEQHGQGQQQQKQGQQHRYPHQHQHPQQIASKEGEGFEEQEAGVAHTVGTTPPMLPSPQFDTSFSLESVLESSGLGEKNETIQKLNEEKGWLDRQLEEMQTRLAQAEKKSEEIESKRRSQMLLR